MTMSFKWVGGVAIAALVGMGVPAPAQTPGPVSSEATGFTLDLGGEEQFAASRCTGAAEPPNDYRQSNPGESVIPAEPLLAVISGRCEVTGATTRDGICLTSLDSADVVPGVCAAAIADDSTARILVEQADPEDVLDVLAARSRVVLRCDENNELVVEALESFASVAIAGGEEIGTADPTTILADDLPLVRLNYTEVNRDGDDTNTDICRTGVRIQAVQNSELAEINIAESCATVPCVAPPVIATKQAAFLTDADGDGEADAGDRLRYTINVTTLDPAGFSTVVLDQIPAGTSADPASVTLNGAAAPTARVESCPGNAEFRTCESPDAQCLILEAGTVTSDAPASIVFDITVNDPCESLRNEGFVCNEVIARAGGRDSRAVARTDADVENLECVEARFATTGGQDGCSIVEGNASTPPGVWLGIGIGIAWLVRRARPRSRGTV